ncbi:uncharacterized protein [Argopecten irradians]
MMCILSLYRVEPSSHLERKAKDWALAQLQSTLKKKPKDGFSVCSVGLSHIRVKESYIDKLSTEVLPALKDRIGDVRVRCSGTHIPGTIYTDSRATVQQVIGVLLSMPQSEEYHNIWTDILWILSILGTEEPWVQEIYQKITSRQCPSQGKRDGLSLVDKTGCRLLWQSYLPSLETTVLHLVDQACDVRLPFSVRHVLEKHFLLEICCEDPVILTAVSQMLQELIRRSGENSQLTWVISMFYQLLQKLCFLTGSHSIILDVLNPGENIVSALLMFKPDTDVDVTADCVCRITDHLQDDQVSSPMLYCRYWYLKIIQTCLSCHSKYLEGCYSFLCWILEPTNKEIQKEIKVILRKCVPALRSLLTKVSLETTDVLYVMQTDHNILDVTQSTISHLVMMFLYKAKAGMYVFKDILSKVCLAETPLDKLVYMLTALEELDVDVTHWSQSQQKEFCSIIQDYVQQASQDNLIGVPDEILTSTSSFLQKIQHKAMNMEVM